MKPAATVSVIYDSTVFLFVIFVIIIIYPHLCVRKALGYHKLEVQF